MPNTRGPILHIVRHRGHRSKLILITEHSGGRRITRRRLKNIRHRVHRKNDLDIDILLHGRIRIRIKAVVRNPITLDVHHHVVRRDGRNSAGHAQLPRVLAVEAGSHASALAEAEAAERTRGNGGHGGCLAGRSVAGVVEFLCNCLAVF